MNKSLSDWDKKKAESSSLQTYWFHELSRKSKNFDSVFDIDKLRLFIIETQKKKKKKFFRKNVLFVEAKRKTKS